MAKTHWNKAKKKYRLPQEQYQEYRTYLEEKFPICQRCNRNPTQDTHHLLYGNYGADKNDKALICVCRDCHTWFHANKRLGQEQFIHTVRVNWALFKNDKKI